MNRSEPAARVYAEAVLLLAKERGRLGVVVEEMHAVLDLLRSRADLWALFTAPRIERAAKEGMILSAFRGRVSEEVLGLLVVLVRKGREALFDNVVDYFDRMRDQLENRVHVDVRSARPLDAAALRAVETAIREASGREPVTHVSTDPALIGGLVVRVGDLVVDGSLRARLRNMGRQMVGERR